MDLDVIANPTAYLWLLRFVGVCSLIANLLMIRRIYYHKLRGFATYKYYMANVQLWSTLLDLHFTILFQPVPLFPLLGGYTRGVLFEIFGIDTGDQFVFCLAPSAVLLILAKLSVSEQRQIIEQKQPAHLERLLALPGLTVYGIERNLWMHLFLIYVTAVVPTMAVYVITITLLIIRELNKQKAFMSANTYRLHMRTTISLVVQVAQKKINKTFQTATPVIVRVIPITIIVFSLLMAFEKVQDLSLIILLITSTHSLWTFFTQLMTNKSQRKDFIKLLKCQRQGLVLKDGSIDRSTPMLWVAAAYSEVFSERQTSFLKIQMEWVIVAGGVQEVELYDCRRSNNTVEDWYAIGMRQPILGICFIIYGVLIEALYLPCLWVISKKSFQKLSCYQIMTFLGYADMIGITVNSLTSGYLLYVGAMFCTHPNLIFVAGVFGLGIWCTTCMACLILVFNRIVELWRPPFMKILFGGYRTWLWMALPVVYGLYLGLFTPPVLFTSVYDGWFFSPFIYEGRDAEYMNNPHSFNNIGLVFLICVMYTVFCCVLHTKMGDAIRSEKMNSMQRSIFLQATAICMANVTGAVIYVYMQFFPTPPLLVLIGHMAWMASHGIPAVVYVTINTTVQREILKLFGCKSYKNFKSLRQAMKATGATGGRTSTVVPVNTSSHLPDSEHTEGEPRY